MLLRNCCVLIGLALLSQNASARVAGMSVQQSFVDANGVSAARAIVRCSTSKEPRTIIRIDGESEWCDSEVKSLCGTQKLKVAQQVCSASYRQSLDEQLAGKPSAAPAKQPQVEKKAVAKSAPKKAAKSDASAVKKAKAAAKPESVKLNEADTVAAQTELLDIEQKRVQIRQRQLELRKLELELEKQRASDIESGF